MKLSLLKEICVNKKVLPQYLIKEDGWYLRFDRHQYEFLTDALNIKKGRVHFRSGFTCIFIPEKYLTKKVR